MQGVGTKWAQDGHGVGTGISAEKIVTISHMTASLNLARSAGVEPTTLGFGIRFFVSTLGDINRHINTNCLKIMGDIPAVKT